jgi:hypothetical protein
MKPLIYAETLIAILVFCFISSCASSKKMALPCLDPSNNYISKHSFTHSRNSLNIFSASQKGKKRSYNFNKLTVHFKRSKNEPMSSKDEQKQQQGNFWLTQSEKISPFNSTDYETNLYTSVENPFILANELSLNNHLAKDKIPDFAYDAVNHERVSSILINSTLSSEVSHLIAEKSNQLILHNVPYKEKRHWAEATMSLMGFALSIVGIFSPLNIAAYTALTAILFGCVVLIGSSGKHWYKGFAIAGLIIGVIVFTVVLIAIL